MKLGRYLIGLISGLTFGMLFAPKKGEKLRSELFKKGTETGPEALYTLFSAFKEAGLDAASEMKKLSDNKEVQAALKMSKEKMRRYLSDLEETGYDLAARAQERIENWSDELAEDSVASVKTRQTSKGKAKLKVVKKAHISAAKGNLKKK